MHFMIAYVVAKLKVPLKKNLKECVNSCDWESSLDDLNFQK